MTRVTTTFDFEVEGGGYDELLRLAADMLRDLFGEYASAVEHVEMAITTKLVAASAGGGSVAYTVWSARITGQFDPTQDGVYAGPGMTVQR